MISDQQRGDVLADLERIATKPRNPTLQVELDERAAAIIAFLAAAGAVALDLRGASAGLILPLLREMGRSLIRHDTVLRHFATWRAFLEGRAIE